MRWHRRVPWVAPPGPTGGTHSHGPLHGGLPRDPLGLPPATHGAHRTTPTSVEREAIWGRFVQNRVSLLLFFFFCYFPALPNSLFFLIYRRAARTEPFTPYLPPPHPIMTPRPPNPLFGVWGFFFSPAGPKSPFFSKKIINMLQAQNPSPFTPLATPLQPHDPLIPLFRVWGFFFS